MNLSTNTTIQGSSKLSCNDQVFEVQKKRYTIITPLGSGTSKTAYIATSEATNQVALLIIRILSYNQYRDVIDEINLLEELGSSKSVVAIVGHSLISLPSTSNEHPSEIILVTELCDRGTVNHWSTPTRSLQGQMEVILKSIEQVQKIHKAGYVHGDIKPDNIGIQFVENQVAVKLLDLGCSRKIGEKTETSKQGTPEYLPPGLNKDSVRQDLFALGATIYEILTQPLHDSKISGMFMENVWDMVQDGVKIEERPGPGVCCFNYLLLSTQTHINDTIDKTLDQLIERNPSQEAAYQSLKPLLKTLLSIEGITEENEQVLDSALEQVKEIIACLSKQESSPVKKEEFPSLDSSSEGELSDDDLFIDFSQNSSPPSSPSKKEVTPQVTPKKSLKARFACLYSFMM